MVVLLVVFGRLGRLGRLDVLRSIWFGVVYSSYMVRWFVVHRFYSRC